MNISNLLSNAKTGNLDACSECPWSPKLIEKIGFGVSCREHGYNWKKKGKVLTVSIYNPVSLNILKQELEKIY